MFVTGRLKNRSWEDKSGQKRSSLEIEAQKVQFLQAMGDDTPGEDTSDDKIPVSKKPVAEPAEEAAGEEEIPF